MRIVGGVHRGRRLTAPPGDTVRPTSDRARESLFNRLAHRGDGPGGTSVIAGARVLDAFCGSGALGLEALSRGAAHASFMDTDRRVLDCAWENAAALGETDRCAFFQADAVHPPPAGDAASLVLLDPPYASGLAGPALAALAAAGWIAPGAVCAVEVARDGEFVPPAEFMVLDERQTGAARIWLLRHGD